MSNKPYPEIRDTQIQWLGEVPVSWDIRRLKYCLELVNEKLDSPPAGESYIGLENIESQTGRVFWPNENGTAEGSCNVFKPGDVLFGKLRPYLAKASIMETGGVCSTEILVFRPRKVDAKFLWYFLLSDGFIKTVDSSTYGAKMPRASWEFIGNLSMLVPHIDEQKNISRFLDNQTAQIDELIVLKEKQIELLEIKRQSIISQAVTRGLDPNVPLKSSGLKWLGEIPENWQSYRLKYLSNKIGSGRTPRGGAEVYSDEGIIFLRSQNIYDDGLRLQDVVYISEDIDEEMADTRVQDGDVLLNITGASIGRTCVVPEGFPRANVNQHVCIIRPKTTKVINHFLAYCLKASSIKDQINSQENGSSRQGLNFEQIGDLYVISPTNIDEQKAIVNYLNKAIANLNQASTAIINQIDFLRQYRQALITNAVTGKIDLRGVDV